MTIIEVINGKGVVVATVSTDSYDAAHDFFDATQLPADWRTRTVRDDD